MARPPLVRPLTLVAFGGNALLRPEDLGAVEEQRDRAEAAAGWLADLVAAGDDLIVVHGNGPQVGQVLIQMEEAATKIPPGTLDLAVAQTEGSMGYLLELALRNRLGPAPGSRSGGGPGALGGEVVTLLTLVLVDAADGAFERPAKPVGPFFSRYRAQALRREHGWEMVEDAGRGWRKVVPSPRPVAALGLPAMRELLARGAVVIAGGGGGIPVVRRADGSLAGVEAVIDKDRTAALLARELRADLLVILTDVPHVAKNFGKKNEEPLRRLSPPQARRLLARGQFPPGSMGPKVEAAMEFVEATGKRALITDVEHLRQALDGEAGTTISEGAARRSG